MEFTVTSYPLERFYFQKVATTLANETDVIRQRNSVKLLLSSVFPLIDARI